MAFQLSPGVNVSEIDLTTVVPSVSTTAGAFAGAFQWGPVNKRILVDSEITLTKRFYQPDSNTYSSFFTAASFLAYGNNLRVVRAANTTSYNADSNNSSPNVQISNEDIFEFSYLHSDNVNAIGPFASRYPGALGNSLTISVLDAGGNFSGWQVNGANVSSYFTGAPGTSAQAHAAGASNDEIHIIVTDTNGLFSGVKNTVLEVFPYLSKASDATDALGNSNYYKNYIFNNSKYIYAADPVDYANTHSTWGKTMSGTSFATVATSQTYTLSGGTDVVPTDADLITAYSLFANSEEVDISLVMTGNADVTVQQYVIDNIVTYRKDCVAFISPRYGDVVNQSVWK